MFSISRVFVTSNQNALLNLQKRRRCEFLTAEVQVCLSSFWTRYPIKIISEAKLQLIFYWMFVKINTGSYATNVINWEFLDAGL